MPALNAISPDKLARLIGTPGAPAIIDIRTDGDDRAVPGSIRRTPAQIRNQAERFTGLTAVLVSADGGADAQAAAAWLRQAGIPAEVLEGGIAAWHAAALPAIDLSALPNRNGPSLWVTRARPKVDRIACPWLIRRFIDPEAVFLFVPTPDVAAVAKETGAEPFDVEGVRWSHDGEACSFDAFLDGFGLSGFEPLTRLAAIVRGADTARPDLAPEAAGLLAVSLGLSRMFTEDDAQLQAGLLVYDALYRWSRDATGERHDWTSHTPRTRTGA
jgi:rhodanese-related sulfurtransferase